MGSVEQVEAWQKGIEEKVGLPPGYMDGFSLRRFRMEQALSEVSVKPTEPVLEQLQADMVFCGLHRITLEDFKSFAKRLKEVSSAVTTVFQQQYSKISLCRSFLRLKSLSGD